MTKTDRAFYVTSPIYYVNDSPHLGHVYTNVACDVLARFKRLDGYKVKFLTGTDEHGLKIKQAADAKGIEPQLFCDEVSQRFRDLTTSMHYSNDDFIRTTEDRHKRGVQAFWKKLVANDQIYLGSYSGWYAVRDEAYYAEDELTLTPDGKRIAPSGAECQWMEENSYFFRLSAWGDRLLEFYAKNPDAVGPTTRLNEVLSFIKGGLKDLSVSRTTFDWGIPVPDAPGHVMYVWIDALANYITALGYPDTQSEEFQSFWPETVHLVGKDILRFHAVYWPAMLMAADLPPPRRIFAHGWWTIEGQKMSKSLGNTIAPTDLINRYGCEQARYFILREVPFGNDGDFSHAQAVARINNDLSNNLGNLVQRTLSFIAKNADAVVPEPGDLSPEDTALLTTARDTLLPQVRSFLDQQRFDKALEAIMNVVTQANVYIDAQAPWTLKKTDPARMKTVLYVLCESIRCISIIIQPVIPGSSGRILDQLAIHAEMRNFSHLSTALKPGTALPSPSGVFPRLQDQNQQVA